MTEETIKDKKKINFFLLCAILTTALFFRFYTLSELPPAMAIDEAVNGIKAQEALSTGDFKFFYSINPLVEMNETFAHEGLYINLLTLSLQVFGRTSPLAVRVVSALIGSITVLGFFLAVREILRFYAGRLISRAKRKREEDEDIIVLGRTLNITHLALLSAFLLAVSFWHVLFSRIGFHAVLTPCTTAFAFYFLFRALGRGFHKIDFIVGGFFLGLVFHTYLSNRVVPFIALAAMGTALTGALIKKSGERDTGEPLPAPASYIKCVAIYWLTWLVTVSPILHYFYTHPGDFLHRAKALSIYEDMSWPVVLIKNFLITLGQFNFRGDEFLRHNIPGAPELLWPVGIFFIIGLTVSLITLLRFTGHLISRKKAISLPALELFLIIWFIVTLAPAFLSSGPHPHAHRGLNAVLPALLLSAIGALFLYERIKRNLRTRAMRTLLVLVSVIILFGIATGEFKRYFYDWAGESELNAHFNKNYSAIADFVNELPEEVTKFIVVDTHFSMSFQFLTDTYIEETRGEKRIVYILPNKPVNIDFTDFRPYVVVPLLYKPELYKTLKEIVPGRFVEGEEFDYFTSG